MKSFDHFLLDPQDHRNTRNVRYPLPSLLLILLQERERKIDLRKTSNP